MIDNPRYPHSILIVREQLDSNGTPIFDENGDPVKITIASSECGLRGLSEIVFLLDKITSRSMLSCNFELKDISRTLVLHTRKPKLNSEIVGCIVPLYNNIIIVFKALKTLINKCRT